MTLGKRELKLLKEVAPLWDYAASVEGEYRQAELYLHTLCSALAVMDRLEKEFYGSATKAGAINPYLPAELQGRSKERERGYFKLCHKEEENVNRQGMRTNLRKPETKPPPKLV